MASFYDSASIITIPSGYKAGTLYSAKPTDGSGDMTFTRTGNTATRVNSAGLIERCITNLALQSNGFDTASWTKANTTIGTGITDPNGGTTAFSLAGSSATSNSKNINQTVFNSGSDVKTFSIYAKANTHSFLQLRFSPVGAFVNFDLSTGTLSNGTNAFGTISSIGNGWYRCEARTASASSNTIAVFQLVNSLSSTLDEASTTTNSVYIWRAQAQLGDLATNYIATTTAAVTEGPVTNLPRLDYLGSTCPQLLMEPTRTNLATYSQMFDNSSWAKDTASVSGNVAVSLDGYQNADIIVEDTSLGFHRITKAASWVSGTTYAISCFVKRASGTRNFGIYFPSTSFGTNFVASFNLTNLSTATTSSSVTAKIENYGNGWYRCIATATANVTTGSGSYSLALRSLDTAALTTYTGDGTSSLYLWGAQVEAGAYATSYIPTTAATVTRNVDFMQKANITSLLGQDEGTMFIDVTRDFSANAGNEATYISLNATSSNRVAIYWTSMSSMIVQVRVNSVIVYTKTIFNTRNRNKIAVAYKLGNLAVYMNGQLIDTNSLSADFTNYNITRVTFEAGATTNFIQSKFDGFLVFKTRLSNDELATLTTL